MNQKNWIIGLVILVVVLVGAITYFTVGKKSEPINNQLVAWNEYSNSYYSDYVISYPDYLKVTEGGQNNRRAIISTQDFKIDMTNGTITFGFKIDVFVSDFDSLDNLFYCNKEKLAEKNCLLANIETQIVDYPRGDVKTESIKTNGYPGVKYEFISNVGKNNNIGLVVKKDDKYYVALIAFRTYKDTALFNRILDSFNFK